MRPPVRIWTKARSNARWRSRATDLGSRVGGRRAAQNFRGQSRGRSDRVGGRKRWRPQPPCWSLRRRSVRARFPRGPSLEAVIVNTAGGIAGGDRFAFDVEVGAGAELTVTTAAAEKVYRALDEPTRRSTCKLFRGAARRSPGCRRRPSCSTARGCGAASRSICADARAAGCGSDGVRPHRHGRDMRRGALFDRWRVRRAGKLVFAENVRLDGAIARAARARGGRGRRHRASRPC